MGDPRSGEETAKDMGLSWETQLRIGHCLSEGQGQEEAHGSSPRLQRQVGTGGWVQHSHRSWRCSIPMSSSSSSPPSE